jgi:O-antigen/teichoic acid export membrane protein
LGISTRAKPEQKHATALLDQVVASAATFLTGVLLGRSLPKEEFGLYTLGFTVATFIADVQTCLISTPYMIIAPRLAGKEKTLYTGSTLIHQLLLSAAAITFLVTIAALAPSNPRQQTFAGTTQTLAMVMPFMLLREYARRVSFAQLTIERSLMLDTLVAVLQIAGVIFLSWTGRVSVAGAYTVIGIACGTATVFWYRSNRGIYSFRVDLVHPHFRESWLQGKWLLASGILWSVSMTMYPWILALFHSTAATASWAACMGIVSVANPVLAGLQNVIGPRLSQAYADRGAAGLRSYAFRTNMVTVLATAPFALFLIILGEQTVTMVYGAAYSGNRGVIVAMSLNLLVSAVAFTYSRGLFVLNRAATDFYINLAAIAVLISAGIWLVRSLGPLGVAISVLASNVVTAMLRYLFYAKTVTAELARSA